MISGLDPVMAEVTAALEALAAGQPVVETTHLDFKEEAGRRGPGGVLTPSHPRNEVAAKALAGEAACMANTDGGGALVVGVADDHTLVGTDLDPDWLRGRVYDLTQRLLTVDARPVVVRDVRLLVIRVPQALEPIRWNNRLSWRIDDRCVEIDATTWHARRMTRLRYDWSAEPSTLPASAARAAAVERARQFLLDSGEDAAADLARARTSTFLRRLNVVTADDLLTNAGALAFVGRGDAAIDYVRREQAGGDSLIRLRAPDRSLLEELDDVVRAVAGANPTRHHLRGAAVGQLRTLPPYAVREAIVNGVVHRDWAPPAPVVVEHVGHRLTVTSPGGFIGGVTPDNIITHPSQPRNRALAELLAALRVAEREGIGVDRMVRDMLRQGYSPPDIREIDGPHVRAVLIGDTFDEGWLTFLDDLDPPGSGSDLALVQTLDHLFRRWWVDATRAAAFLQSSAAEATDVLNQLAQVRIDGVPVTATVQGTPEDQPPAWRLTAPAVVAYRARAAAVAAPNARAAAPSTRGVPPARDRVALSWARARGRISSTELASIVGAAPSNVGSVLKGLEEQGLVAPGRAVRRGAGFFYVPTG